MPGAVGGAGINCYEQDKVPAFMKRLLEKSKKGIMSGEGCAATYH